MTEFFLGRFIFHIYTTEPLMMRSMDETFEYTLL